MRIVTVKQMRALENEANTAGTGFDRMIDHAGKGLAEAVHTRYWSTEHNHILGLIGSGNNGGDALVTLTYLCGLGWKVRAYLTKPRTNDTLVADFLGSGGELVESENDQSFTRLKKWCKETNLLLDGILGIGIVLPLRGNLPNVLAVVKSVKPNPIIVAVDCPSGIDCDSGEVSKETLTADLTICLGAVKIGLLKKPASQYVGEIAVVPIGLAKSLPTWKTVNGELMERHIAESCLPLRPDDAHKGTFGTCMVVAGSVNYCGAVMLAAEAAYRVGAGLVQAAIPGAIYEAVSGSLPEAIWLVLPHTDGVINADAATVIQRSLDKINALLVGPGISSEAASIEFIDRLIDSKEVINSRKRFIGFASDEPAKGNDKVQVMPPMVIDADGLRALALIPDWSSKLPRGSILTPHPGEMSALTGMPIDAIQKSRISVALEFAQKWGHVVVLKGAQTVIANPSGVYTVNPVSTSALATAGTGDILAGMIAGYVTQGLKPYSAAILSVWLHAQAGLIASENLGSTTAVIARDVLRALPVSIKQNSRH
jgi:NAD(P)H-hydrate epimerase